MVPTNQYPPSMPPNMNMMQMMPMFIMAQMTAQQSSMNPSSQSTGQIPPFDPNMMHNFINMTRQWQAFLAWQQQSQNVSETNHVGNNRNSYPVCQEQYPPNSSNNVTQSQGYQNHPHPQQSPSQHRRPPPSARHARLDENKYSRKRYFEEDPRRK